ncbi:MAG: beta-galactosidase [Verrucomicrobia bacterium]|nr:beta-galactosidase [Verrucomicrobiota bacterium]
MHEKLTGRLKRASLGGCLCWFGVASALSARAADATPLRPWTDYRVILWVGDSAYKQPQKLPLFFQRLRQMGVNTAMIYDGADPAALVENHFPYYVENIVNRGLCLKFSSKVTDWDKFVTAWGRTRDDAALVRDYSLDDPAWRAWAEGEMRDTVRKNRAHQPLAYNIRDELSVTTSANPFDYDFAPITLRAFRDWLKTQYSGLDALNRAWEARFASWDEVKPFTTDQIKNRMVSGDATPRGKPDWQALEQLRFDPISARQQPTRWNFSPWADFRTYLDISLARTLDDLRRVAHEADPRTPVGIEGTQMPAAFGGYDLWRLSRVLDWVEPYDIGNSREILGSFMPGQPIVTTVFEKDTRPAQRRLWHLLLNGDRGCIVWWSEDCLDWSREDYPLTAKALALAPAFREMTGPLAGLFLRAEREFDPVAIHYSQPSIQADWLLESTVDGSTWLRRFSSFESSHNRLVRVRDSWLKLFQDLGYSPRFVSSEQIENGELERRGVRVLVLPDSLALSDLEAAKIRAFLASPDHAVFCDGTPGLFDQHARLRSRSPLEGSFPPATSAGRSYGARGATTPATAVAKPGDISAYAAERLESAPANDWPRWVADQIRSLPPAVTVTEGSRPAQTPRVAVFRYRLGRGRLFAFERNIDYQMSEELKQAGGNQNLERPITVEARFPFKGYLYDLRARQYLGETDHATFTLDPWQPTIFALLREEITAETLPGALLQD